VKKFISTFLLSVLFFTGLMVPSQASAMAKVPANKGGCNEAAANLKVEGRKLWQDHVLWTRDFIKSDLAGLEDKDKVLERLLKNQDDIGNSIKPYYGEEAGRKLSQLLREHIIIGGQVVDAAKKGKKDELTKYDKLWQQNADKITSFLSGANPNWNNKQLKDMLYKHLQFVTNQVVARLNKNWMADIEAYDLGEDHMLMFSDVITEGIVKQFPQKFK